MDQFTFFFLFKTYAMGAFLKLTILNTELLFYDAECYKNTPYNPLHTRDVLFLHHITLYQSYTKIHWVCDPCI
jgi:hypothetical protein